LNFIVNVLNFTTVTHTSLGLHVSTA